LICKIRKNSEGGITSSFILKMNGQNRNDIYPGLEVDIILKKDQRSGKRTRGIVKDLLTSSAYHSRGIKVRLEDGQIGRVAEIID
jgi:uncharacterized repeat protein (TIGR03833 family)